MASKRPAWMDSKAMKITMKVLSVLGKTILTAGLVLVIAGCVVACVLTVYVSTTFNAESNLPDVESINKNQTTIVMTYNTQTKQYEEDTRLQGVNREWVDYKDMPANLVNAIIAIEDERFNQHYGVDWKRTIAAVANLVLHFNDTEFGGSTITQQLVKNLTGDDDKKIQRKMREILTAIELESVYSKEEILQAYLNILPLTGDIEGVGAGAKYYFNKDVGDLTLAQCAVLASITNNPSKYDPYRHPKELQRRQRTVLKKMYELGMINSDEYNQAMGEELYFEQGFSRTPVYDYYTDMLIDDVTASLIETYGYTETQARNTVLYGGLTIYSCEDPELQAKAEAIYADDANFPAKRETDEKDPQAAIYVMDYTGRCVAVVGGRGEKTANLLLNRATDSVRQPGSCMKPLSIYAPAIKLNLVHFSSAIPDAPITLRDGTLWPVNYNQTKPTDSGMTLLDYAVQSSKNTVPARILYDNIEQGGLNLTPQYSFNFIKNYLNISTLVVSDGKGHTDVDYAPMALGGMTNGVYPREMAAAYQMFGNGGYYNEPYSFYKVEQNGKVILENKSARTQVLDTDTAYIMNRLLQNVVFGSNGATAGGIKNSWKEWQIFAKTGTTQQNNDVWFVGGTPKYVAASWFGYDLNQQLTAKQTSGARNLWNKVMQTFHEGDEPMNFDNLKGTTVEASYCAETGLLAGPNCKKIHTGVYKPDHMPGECVLHNPVIGGTTDNGTGNGNPTNSTTTNNTTGNTAGSTSSGTSSSQTQPDTAA